MAHDHKINVAQEMHALAKAQMKKALKGQIVKCGHIWQSLYNQKVREGLAPPIEIDSENQPTVGV